MDQKFVGWLINLLSVLVLLTSHVTLGYELDSIKAERKKGRIVIYHQVERGETLFSLGKRYGAEIDKILKENKMEDNSLSIDQVLMIPIPIKKRNQESSPVRTSHTVKTGETLYSISRAYDIAVDQLKEWNGMEDNQLNIGSVIWVAPEIEKNDRHMAIQNELVEPPSDPGSEDTGTSSTHVVLAGETLYALAKRYQTSVDDIINWNHLEDYTLSVGQVLSIRPDSTGNKPIEKTTEPPAKSVDEKASESTSPKEKAHELSRSGNVLPNGFEWYQVQTGETMKMVSDKFHTVRDSIMRWNDLRSSYLSIGQKIMVRSLSDSLGVDSSLTHYKSRRKDIDDRGFMKVFEEGIAMKITESVETQKYLALHPSLPIGTLIEVRNIMNNQKVFVRVVGKLPPTGLNQGVMIRLSQVCFGRLGIIDPKARVEISYYDE